VVVGERHAPAARRSTEVPSGTAHAALEGLKPESLAVIETNIDDMNPELYSYVMERLFAAGALDVWLQPVQMKKNRPAVVCGVLCNDDSRTAVIETVLRETSTLGVRVTPTVRYSVPRSSQSVTTPYGPVRVKVADWAAGGVWRAAPEYADVERVASTRGVPAWLVYQAALASAEQLRPGAATEVNS